MNEQTTSMGKEVLLENIITSAIKMPGVKVNREAFLVKVFSKERVDIHKVIDYGPIAANVSQERLAYIANKHILKQTSVSSAGSFALGLPGGLAMAATIPADVLQFFGYTLKLAQELSYLYGADDLWQDGQVDDEKVRNQLLLYCGVMFGVSGAVSGVRVLSTQIAKTTLKKLPQKALTKTFWYPIIKQIGKAIGVKVTKSTVAKGVSKAIPVLGGVVSGGLNFASMMPMAKRLQKALDSGSFGYTIEDMQKDIEIIENLDSEKLDSGEETDLETDIVAETDNSLNSSCAAVPQEESKSVSNGTEDILALLEKLSDLKDKGILTQEEFDSKKAELLAKL